MLTVDEYTKIRIAYRDGLSIRVITVTKMSAPTGVARSTTRMAADEVCETSKAIPKLDTLDLGDTAVTDRGLVCRPEEPLLSLHAPNSPTVTHS